MFKKSISTYFDQRGHHRALEILARKLLSSVLIYVVKYICMYMSSRCAYVFELLCCVLRVYSRMLHAFKNKTQQEGTQPTNSNTSAHPEVLYI
jgi:hypothetical protein